MGGKDFFCDGLSHGATPVWKNKKWKNKQPTGGLSDQLDEIGLLHSAIWFVNSFPGRRGGVKTPEHLYRWDSIAYTVAAV